ncbi:hypothetical protein C351_02148 [Cryptococcus neoformans c8]|nr:hypothetical protein C351_02148 [Cryptococcus neoformans var. grubii c8]
MPSCVGMERGSQSAAQLVLPFGSRFTSPQWSPHTPPDRTAIPGHRHFSRLYPSPAPGEIPPFGHARLSAAHYYVSGLRDMTSFDCAHLSQSGTRFFFFL